MMYVALPVGTAAEKERERGKEYVTAEAQTHITSPHIHAHTPRTFKQ